MISVRKTEDTNIRHRGAIDSINRKTYQIAAIGNSLH